MNTQIFENFRNVISLYTFLLLFKKTAPNGVTKKKAEALSWYSPKSLAFLALFTVSQRWPFFATNEPEANMALPPTAHPQ